MATGKKDQCTLCLKSSRASMTRQLPCEHLFCVGCSIKIRQTKISCPKCRQPIPAPNPSKHEAPEIYDEISEVKPIIKPIKGELYSRMCPTHLQKTEFFCYTCKKAVCSKCLHADHKIREHDIASLVDFKEDKIKEQITALEEFHKRATASASGIDAAREFCQKDEEALQNLVQTAQQKAIQTLNSHGTNLSKKLKLAGKTNANVLSRLDVQYKEMFQEIDKVKKECEDAIKGLKSNELKTKTELEDIKKQYDAINQKYNKLQNVHISQKLGLRFKENIDNGNFGKFTNTKTDEGNEVEYGNIFEAPHLIPKDEMDIVDVKFDYANIIFMEDDWFVHVSNVYGTKSITIKHFNLSKKQECREEMILDLGCYNWFVANKTGHDRSILIASGQNVFRISFRRHNDVFRVRLPVSIEIEGICWDEFGVDCYLLGKNLQDVYWLTMTKSFNSLCTFNAKPESVCSMTVNKNCKVALLDTTMSKVHALDYNDPKNEKSVSMKHQALPKEWKSTSQPFSAHAVATRKNSSFILFSKGDYVAVGLFDEAFCFRGWVMARQMPFPHDVLDIAVINDSVILLLDEKVYLYNIPEDMTP